jgi:glycosyltransferase involved in cell wall biosynthesis
VFTRTLFGSERYAADLASRQRVLGHDVAMAIDPQSQVPSLLGEEIPVWRIGSILRGHRLSELIVHEQPDILHAHLSAACKVLSRMRHRPPAVATLHVGYKAHQQSRLDGLIALTTHDLAEAAAFSGRVERIGNWIPHIAPLAAGARAEARRALGIPAEHYVIGFVGRLHPSKNPGLLVSAYRRARLADTTLVLVGDGPERKAIKELAAGDPSIRLLGYRDDAQRLLAAFDLFVLPSRFDPFPLVLMETMAAGLPIATTRDGGPGDFMPSPPTRLFASEDETALTAILKAERDLGQRRESYDLSPFDPERQVEKIIRFYREVGAGRLSPLKV